MTESTTPPVAQLGRCKNYPKWGHVKSDDCIDWKPIEGHDAAVPAQAEGADCRHKQFDADCVSCNSGAQPEPEERLPLQMKIVNRIMRDAGSYESSSREFTIEYLEYLACGVAEELGRARTGSSPEMPSLVAEDGKLSLDWRYAERENFRSWWAKQRGYYHEDEQVAWAAWVERAAPPSSPGADEPIKAICKILRMEASTLLRLNYSEASHRLEMLTAVIEGRFSVAPISGTQEKGTK